MAFFLFPAAACASSNVKMELRFPDNLATAGEAFRVALEVTENPGFQAIQFTLVWEPEDMVCQQVSFGSLLDGALGSSNPSAPEGAIVAAISLEPITEKGTLAVFTFRSKSASANARWGLADMLISDGDNHSVPFEIVGATLLTETEVPRAADVQTVPSAPKASGGTRTDAPEPSGGTQADTLTTPETLPPVQTEEETPFTDIAGSWAEDYIRQGYRLRLFGGYSDGSFRPGNYLTRAQFMTVLWNLANRPLPETESPFKDMETQIPVFQNAVAWAYGRGIVDGTTPVSFLPSAPLTRQAAMKILFGYDGGESGLERLLTDVYDKTFTDSQSISSWGKKGMYWGVYHEIITGATPTTLNPTGLITRAQMAAIMVRYVNDLKSTVLPE